MYLLFHGCQSIMPRYHNVSSEPQKGLQSSSSTLWRLVDDLTQLQNHLAKHPTLPPIDRLQLLSHYPPFQKFIFDNNYLDTISEKQLNGWLSTSTLTLCKLQTNRTLKRARNSCLDHLSKISVAKEYSHLLSWLQALAKFNKDLTVVLQTDKE